MPPLLRTDAGAELDEIIVGVHDFTLERLGGLAVVHAFVESNPTTSVLNRLADFRPRHSTTHGHHVLRRELIVQRSRESN